MYIIIDTTDPNMVFVLSDDATGKTLTFDSLEKADEIARKHTLSRGSTCRSMIVNIRRE